MIIRCISQAAVLEHRATDGSAGIDLVAAERAVLDIMVPKSISTGLRVEIPQGYVGFTRARSGLAFRENVWAFEGTIDSDYRGIIHLQFISFTKQHIIEPGTRVGQLVIVPYAQAKLVAVDSLDTTERGEKGFGSSGV